MFWYILLVIGMFALGYNTGKELCEEFPERELKFIQRILKKMEKLDQKNNQDAMNTLIEIQKEIIKELDHFK